MHTSHAITKWTATRKALLCTATALLFVFEASAAEVAILRNGFTIRHDHRKIVGANTRLFLGADDSSFTDVPSAEITGYEPAPDEPKQAAPSPVIPQLVAPPSLNQVVDSASQQFRLDPDLVNSVIHAESGFNSRAVSPKGAVGLMQLMPGTANELGVNNAYDPQSNVQGGSKYLRELLEKYNFDMVKALAAYNAGPKRVEQYRGVPPYRETQAYVARIVHEYNKKKIAEEKAAKAHSTQPATTKTMTKTAPTAKTPARAKSGTSTTGSSR